MRRQSTRYALVMLAASAVVGCRRSAPPSFTQEPESTSSNDGTPQEQAQQIFATRCMPCHGATGAGDGPASAGLTPRPRNFHDTAWQTAVTDSHIERIIQFGGPAVGKSPAMPPNPDLIERAPIVAALRVHVRSLAQ